MSVRDVVTMRNMHRDETPPRLKVLTVRLTEAEHAEFQRLAAGHLRSSGKQGQVVIREWIAAEQAAEATEAAA